MTTCFHKEIDKKGVNGEKLALCAVLNNKGKWVVSVSQWYVNGSLGKEYWADYRYDCEIGARAWHRMSVEQRKAGRLKMIAKYSEGVDVDTFLEECWLSLKP